MLKYDDFAQRRTIRSVTPYPGSPLYYDAIEMGLLDKDNPAEDFYEKKHLNSDLICSNFTELSDEEFYEGLRWANTTLMKNYYNKQRNNTEAQINYLYDTKDVTFRGFRHHSPLCEVGETFEKKSKNIFTNENKFNGNSNNSLVEETKNWENSMTGDGERFSQQLNKVNGSKTEKSYEIYLKRKEKTAAEKKTRKQKVLNTHETSSLYTNFHGQTRS